MPIALDRRLQTCSEQELQRLMRELSVWWESKGCPSEDEMPRNMRREWIRLRAEFRRRGVQLRLF